MWGHNGTSYGFLSLLGFLKNCIYQSAQDVCLIITFSLQDVCLRITFSLHVGGGTFYGMMKRNINIVFLLSFMT
jgi:hypothetical protein